MEAVLLMLEVIAISQVLIWAARGRGGSGFFGWKSNGSEPGAEQRPGWRGRSSGEAGKG